MLRELGLERRETVWSLSVIKKMIKIYILVRKDQILKITGVLNFNLISYNFFIIIVETI